MIDQIEQLYISAIQGEWDSTYFAERMMELISDYNRSKRNEYDSVIDAKRAAMNAIDNFLFPKKP